MVVHVRFKVMACDDVL